MDRIEQVQADSGNQEPSEAEKVLGSMPEFYDRNQESKTEKNELLKDEESVRDVHYKKLQNRIKKAVENGYYVDHYINDLSLNDLAHSIDTLSENGADMDDIRFRFDRSHISIKPVQDNIIIFKKYNPSLDINKYVYEIDSRDKVGVIENIDAFLENGADINVNEFASELQPNEIIENIDTLENHGARIDVEKLYTELSPREIAENFESLSQHGVEIDIKELTSELSPFEIAQNLDTLKNNGAEIDMKELVSKLNLNDIARNIDSLNKNGADINLGSLIKNTRDIKETLAYGGVDLMDLKKHGVAIENILSEDRQSYGTSFYDLDYTSELSYVKTEDVNNHATDQHTNLEEILDNIDALIENNIDVNILIKRLSNENGAMRYEEHEMLERALERNGLNPDDIKSEGGIYGPYRYEHQT